MKSARLLALALMLAAGLAFGVGLTVPAFAQEHGEAAAVQEGEHAEDEHAQEPEGDHAEEDDHGAAAGHGDEGGHGDEEHHVAVPTMTEYIYKWINFGLLLVVLYWLLVAPPAFVKENFEFDGLKVILAQRAKDIVAARELAREQKGLAASGRDESAARLAKIEEEAAALVATARDEAARDKARVIEDAESQAEKIRAGASRDMQAEVTRASRDLQTHVAHLAVNIATDLVKKNLSDADQDRLVRAYLDELGTSVS